MRIFDHIGLTATDPQPNERYVQKTKVWVTDPAQHPCRVEWLRYESDSTVPLFMQQNPHIAFHVDSIEKERVGMATLLEPFSSVAGHVVGFFQTSDGVIVELMEY